MASRGLHGKPPVLTTKEVRVRRDQLDRGALDRVVAVLRAAAEPRRRRHDRHRHDLAEMRARRELEYEPRRRATQPDER
jgi:Zn-finger nucleic acid-binding protein